MRNDCVAIYFHGGKLIGFHFEIGGENVDT
jgi:hypothetical protein